MKEEKHIHLFGRIVFGDGLPRYGEFFSPTVTILFSLDLANIMHSRPSTNFFFDMIG
jgi:hypothetical protein